MRVFVSPAQLAKFMLSLNRVIDTASVTTGWGDPQGVVLAFFVCNRSPLVCTKAGGGFVYSVHVFKFHLPVRESRTPSSEGSSEAPRH